MRKFVMYLSILTVLRMLLWLNVSLSSIKPATFGFMEKREHVQQLNVSGEFQAKDKVDVSLSYPLYIKDVYITENSYVNNGQALFSIDKEMMMKIINGEARIDLSPFSDNSQLLKYLANRKSDVSVASLPEIIYAPTSGIVTGVNIAAGTFSMPDTPLLTIGSSDQIIAKFSLSQLDYGKISVGDSVKITPVAFSNIKYNGTITNDNAVVKKTSTLNGNKVVVDVFAHISDADAKVADGLQINGVVNIGEPETINGIDYTFINQDENGQYVLVLDQGKADKVYIETGLETRSFIELIADFSEDTVFLKGDIKEGDRVILCSN